MWLEFDIIYFKVNIATAAHAFLQSNYYKQLLFASRLFQRWHFFICCNVVTRNLCVRVCQKSNLQHNKQNRNRKAQFIVCPLVFFLFIFPVCDDVMCIFTITKLHTCLMTFFSFGLAQEISGFLQPVKPSCLRHWSVSTQMVRSVLTCSLKHMWAR